jgi:hypothetical protein
MLNVVHPFASSGRHDITADDHSRAADLDAGEHRNPSQ